MPREALGEFEQLVLLAVLQLGEGTYGVPIVREIERRTERSVAPAAVYVALQRLEKKGLVQTWLSPPGPEGGRHRRHVRVQPQALDLLRASHQTLKAMRRGLEPLLEGK